jgi:sigma-B regulation protein RsbU (phosphoserine phosphatase)
MAGSRDGSLPHALLHTLPGRAMVVGLAVKLIVLATGLWISPLPAFLDVIDTVAGLAVAAGAVYFLVRLAALVRRRLLWRVRRKLILSYIFIGFVPAILIVAFFLLCGLLLFYNLSSYLLQSRLDALAQQVRFIASRAVVDIQRSGGRNVMGALVRARTAAGPDFSDLSLAVVPVSRDCTTITDGSGPPERTIRPAGASIGSWPHTAAPAALPDWVGCDGVAGLFAGPSGNGSGADAYMLVRAAALPDLVAPGYAVIADLAVEGPVRRRLRADTGVEIVRVGEVDRTSAGSAVAPLAGTAERSGVNTNGLLSWVSLLDYRRWDDGRPGTLLMLTELSISEVYNRITGAQGLIGDRSFGATVLLVLLVVVGGLFLVIEVVALALGLVLARSITGSVHALFEGTERVRQGDFTHKIAVPAQDQLGELAQSFNTMTASIEDLLQQAAEKKRLEEELRIAHEIQMSLLPQGRFEMPGLSVTALCVPAREVGGDYYDFLPLGPRRLGLLIADVSGKGTSAALYMAELKGLMLSLGRIHSSPRDLLIAANRIISEHLDARTFITMTYAVLDLDAGTMTYARAGHTPLIYVPGPASPQQGARVLAPDGMVVGLKLDDGATFERLLEEQTLDLHAGDLYVFFTDGISEAMDATDDCFGETRLSRIAEAHAHLPPDQLRERILREVAAFVGTTPQHDDMTMILLKVERLAAEAAAAS